MSSSARKDEKRAEWARQQEANEAERLRRAGRSMWQKIEDAESICDVREILHELADKVGAE